MNALTVFLFAGLAMGSGRVDRYSSFAELSRHEKEGKDYRVDALDRGSRVLVLAIHGGWIEEGSEEAARAIAGEKTSLYVFHAMKKSKNWDLHVTSTHFDDPRALALAKKSGLGVSIHGFKEARLAACIGGGNAAVAKKVAAALRRAIPDVAIEAPCARYDGESEANIANRCAEGGVQIELSSGLRKRLLKDAKFLATFASAVRESLL